MRFFRELIALFLLLAALPMAAQGFERGDVVVTSLYYDSEEGFPISSLRVHARSGAFKSELLNGEGEPGLSEPLVRDGVVYVASRARGVIDRIDAAGTLLAPFAGPVYNVNFLGPGPGGGLLAVNGSGEIYHFAADGSLAHFRDFTAFPGASGGIELARDQCTVIYATGGMLAKWNACTDAPAALFGPALAAASGALRLLPDGTFLITVIGLYSDFGNNRVIHVDADGNLIRSYPVPGNALAIDIDGKSFWTNAGNYLLRIDIENGTLISQTFTEFGIMGLSVVGEPRAGFAAAAAADVPVLTPPLLLLLTLILVITAFIRLRTS
ncbi:MAG: hypothetical protein M3P06_11750 [Acidobacteriota bacterium]|nr:hypothetical protein [Acidobacteriota bacterium]